MILGEGGQEKNAAWEAEVQHSLGIIHSFIHSFTDKAPIHTGMIVVLELWRQILVSVSLGEKEDCFQRKQGEHGRGVLSIVPEMQQELSAYCYMNTYC